MSYLILLGTHPGVQFVSVLLIFAFVVALTFFTSKWIANFEKEKNSGNNISVIETSRIAQNKYIQIVRIADKYYAYAVCKDSITLIGEVDKDSLVFNNDTVGKISFKDFLNKARENGKETK